MQEDATQTPTTLDLDTLKAENKRLKAELEHIRIMHNTMLDLKQAAEFVIETLPAGGACAPTLRYLEEAVVDTQTQLATLPAPV